MFRRARNASLLPHAVGPVRQKTRSATAPNNSTEGHATVGNIAQCPPLNSASNWKRRAAPPPHLSSLSSHHIPAGRHQSLRDRPLPLPQGENLQTPVRRGLAFLGAEAQQVVVHVGAGAEDEDEGGDADGVSVGRLEVERRGLGERRSQVFLPA